MTSINNTLTSTTTPATPDFLKPDLQRLRVAKSQADEILDIIAPKPPQPSSQP